MSETTTGVTTRPSDLIDALAGIEPGSPLSDLRNRRSEISQFIQGSYDALLEPADLGGISRVERGLVALRSALPSGSTLLVEHYRDYSAQHGASPALIKAASGDLATAANLPPRLVAILRHTDLLTHEPIAATPAHLAQLQAAGLSTPDIVTISQLIAFVSFQVRTLSGLQLLGESL